GRADAEVDVVGGDGMQVLRLVAPAAADGALLDPHRHFLGFDVLFDGPVDGGFAQAHVDAGFGQHFLAGVAPKLAQHALGGGHRGQWAGDAEHVAAVADLHAQSQLEQAQVGVERPRQVGQALGVGGGEGEFGDGLLLHRGWREGVCPACKLAPAGGFSQSGRHLQRPRGQAMRGLRSVAGAVVTALCAVAAMPALAQSATGAQVTVLTASRIDTMDAERPRAQAMAYDAEGRILALGSREEMLQRYPRARRVDVGGATVVPGLIDAHGHMLGLGMAHLTADLVGTSSKQEIVQRLQAFAATLPSDAWLIGRGWDQNDWAEKQFPTAADLDAAFPDRPVWLSRIDGHAGWANSAAMRAIERDLSGASTTEGWQPDGGRIVRDDKGQATGVFVDEAMGLVYAVVPEPTGDTLERALKLAMDDAVAHGLTGVHDAGVSLGELRIMQRLADDGEMPMRITAMADGNGKALEWLCQEGLYQH